MMLFILHTEKDRILKYTVLIHSYYESTFIFNYESRKMISSVLSYLNFCFLFPLLFIKGKK